jgi:hypothetical protein
MDAQNTQSACRSRIQEAAVGYFLGSVTKESSRWDSRGHCRTSTTTCTEVQYVRLRPRQLVELGQTGAISISTTQGAAMSEDSLKHDCALGSRPQTRKPTRREGSKIPAKRDGRERMLSVVRISTSSLQSCAKTISRRYPFTDAALRQPVFTTICEHTAFGVSASQDGS